MVSNVDTATVRQSASLQARRWLWPALLAAVLIALPLFVPRYWVYFAGLLGINIVAAHGLNIMMGYTGLLSLGHAAFLGVGAYTVALAQIHLGLPFWITIPLGGLAAAVIRGRLRPALPADPRPVSRHRDAGGSVHPEFRVRALAESHERRRRPDRPTG